LLLKFYDLNFEIQKLQEQLAESKAAHQQDIKSNEMALNDIQEQYASNKRYSRKLKAEIKKLRQYKLTTESVNRGKVIKTNC
jgi:predicted Holliday junction resolvase-like endonuclease